MAEQTEFEEGPLVSRLRRFLLFILALGMTGTAADLLLIEHYEDTWQAPPLVLIALALCLLAALWIKAGWIGVMLLRVTMALFIAAGTVGVLMHYNGNSEFQKEIDPNLSGWPLFVKVMTAKAPPALAPGVMVQLGLLGLVYTYRHPALLHPAQGGSRKATGAKI
jgi:hypothetical protein